MENKVCYNWATLGTGVIANELAQALQQLGGKLYSVANRTHQKGLEFAQKYGIEKVLVLCYTQYTRYTHFFKKMSTRIILKNSVNIGTAETQNTVLWTVYLMPCTI